MIIDRPALRYYGGKWRVAPWIIAHFPRHGLYCEPYAGGASVLLQKERSPLEVLNDLDGEVCNFWRMLRERTEELIRAIDLTPFSREEVDVSYKLPEDADPLERARAFFVRSWQTRTGPTAQRRGGWRYTRTAGRRHVPAVIGWDNIGHLWAVADRLKRVQLEHDDALACIKRFDGPDSLFYIDPPYLWALRSKWRRTAYRHEMSEADHEALAEVLHGLQGMAIISGYESELYADLYAGWETATRIARTESAGARTEVLWISPRASERARQGRLFSGVAVGE